MDVGGHTPNSSETMSTCVAFCPNVGFGRDWGGYIVVDLPAWRGAV